MSSTPGAQPPAQRHSLFDDFQGLATGTLFVALGLHLLAPMPA